MVAVVGRRASVARVRGLLTAAGADPWSRVLADLEAEGLIAAPDPGDTPAQPFEPIVVPGEPVSTTLMRERR